MKRKIKIFLRVLLIAVAFVLYVYGMYLNIDGMRTVTRCGDIRYMRHESAAYRVSARDIMLIYFNDLGRTVELEVSIQTFVNHKVGDTVCFEFNKSRFADKSVAQILLEMYAFLVSLVIVLFMMVGLVVFVWWLFNND